MIRIAAFALALGVLTPFQAAAETLRALTSGSLAPFTRAADAADMPGFNVEFVRAIAADAGYDIEIEHMNWREAQDRVAAEPDLLLFGATRTETREPKYDWVTNLLTVRHLILTVGSSIPNLEAARETEMIAARSVYYRILENAGFENIVDMGHIEMLEALVRGEVSAVYTLIERATFNWTRELQLEFGMLSFSEEVGRSDIWLAASPGYDPVVMERLNASAQRLRADGTYEALWVKYFGSLDIVDMAWPEKKPTYQGG